MHELQLKKPDGRHLTLYSRRPIDPSLKAPSPQSVAQHANPHLRWHPLRGEWVAYAPHRQNRTFLPPPDYNPLRSSNDGHFPTEMPLGDYDIAVFDNLYPSLSLCSRDPPKSIVASAPADGRCEVVVFTQDPSLSLARLPLPHIELLLEVWGDRSEKMGRNPKTRYVMPFENRGAEVGVTLHHPHGQIYAYPFVPPIPSRMHDIEAQHLKETGKPLLQGLIEAELNDVQRIIYHGDHAVAFVPAWARYPYEVWVATTAAVPDFVSLNPVQRADLARALKTTLLKYDALWQQPFPYLMAWYQAPVGFTERAAVHLHAEIMPPYRMKGRLKYLAGTELAAGMFANDALPEEKARELQAVEVVI
ncbi:MAG: galactose-1-phosphate uridylyltransferase [Pseudomonadota bacterium]|nr:galactose-1-phosphate uridylyltransferase [Pseudomonadota bacterium]